MAIDQKSLGQLSLFEVGMWRTTVSLEPTHRLAVLCRSIPWVELKPRRVPPIRTVVEMEVRIELRSEQRFLYQEIGDKVAVLTKLGMSHRAIAVQMGIDRNTVCKALRWRERSLC